MSYIVKSPFEEDGHLYGKGSEYPADGEVSEERINHLMKPFENSEFSFLEKAVAEEVVEEVEKKAKKATKSKAE